MPTASQSFLDRLSRLGTGNLSDALGKRGALPSAIAPLHPSMACAGPVETVICAPADNLAIHHALAVATPGSILFISIGGFCEAGHFGEILATMAQVRGLAGVIIDGSCRDRTGIVELGFPVFARALNPAGTQKYVAGELGVPIACGATLVRPGDFIRGDADGVVIVPVEQASEAVLQAEHIVSREQEMLNQVRAGKTTLEILGLRSVY